MPPPADLKVPRLARSPADLRVRCYDDRLARPPADLTRSTRPDEYKQLIIRLGGERMGRSPGMPPWGEELSQQQIEDVVHYLRTVSTVKTVGQ